MASALEAYVHNRLSLLSMMSTIQQEQPGSVGFLTRASQTVADLTRAFRQARDINVAQALRVTEQLRASNIPEDMQRTLATILENKVNGNGNAPAEAKQNMKYFDKYLSAELAQTIKGNHFESKLRGGSQQLVHLGAVLLNEKSWAHCLSVLLQLEEVGSDEKLIHLQTLKDLVKAGGTNARVGPLEYPEDVGEFIQQHPQLAAAAFGEGQQPVPSEWDHVTRAMASRMVPCRTSNKMCTGRSSMETMMSDSVRANRMRSPSFVMQPRNSFRDSDSSVHLPGLKIFQPPQSHNRGSAGLDANALMNMGWVPPGHQRTSFQPENNFPALEWQPPPSQQPPQGSQSLPPGHPTGGLSAGLPGSKKAPPTTSASEVDDITKKIQDKFKHGLGEDGEDKEDESEEDKETGGDDEDQQRVSRKRPAGATDGKAAKAAKAKGKSGSDNGGKANQPSIANVEKCLKLVQANLRYKGKKGKPMHFKTITIYTNKKGFRVKPGFGRRDERIVGFGDDPRAAFLAAQKHAATYLAMGA